MKTQSQSPFTRRVHQCLLLAAGVVTFAFSVSNARAGAGDTKTGVDALVSQTASCTNNTADGNESLYSLAAGNGDTAIGASTLIYTSASDDTALGYAALYSDQNGGSNTAVGAYALDYLSTGSFNIAIGASAGTKVTTGTSNIYIGATGTGNESNVIRIGNPANTTGPTCIAGIRYSNLPVGSSSNVVIVDSSGHLATDNVSTDSTVAIPTSVYSADIIVPGEYVYMAPSGIIGYLASAARFKKDIKPMDKASEEILSLKPVTFHYKKDPSQSLCYGLIAEEVAKVDPNLVTRNPKGELNTVRYEQVNAMLLNEFLKEHQKVEKQAAAAAEQDKKLASLEAAAGDQSKKIAGLEASIKQQKSLKATVAEQQQEIETLTASLKEQGALIQKVSAQLDAGKQVMRTADNDQ